MPTIAMIFVTIVIECLSAGMLRIYVFHYNCPALLHTSCFALNHHGQKWSIKQTLKAI